jgi:hypothetical protein
MTFARVIPLPLGLACGLLLSCSDPPSPPAQAAFTITVSPGGTGSCTTTHGPAGVPTDDTSNTIYNQLHCDRKSGCTPDQFVRVDGQEGDSVSCSVKSNGNGFDVQFEFISGHMTLTGTSTAPVTQSQGALTMNSVYEGQDSLKGTCNTIINPPHVGGISAGQIWATFNCPEFSDPTAPGSTACAASGAFIFENCSK